jgi:hypothetical protein
MELYSGICEKRGGVGTEKVDHLPELLLLADGSRELSARPPMIEEPLSGDARW